MRPCLIVTSEMTVTSVTTPPMTVGDKTSLNRLALDVLGKNPKHVIYLGDMPIANYGPSNTDLDPSTCLVASGLIIKFNKKGKGG